jgi:hypothetical protein
VDTVDGAQGFDPSKFEGFGPRAGPETQNVIDEGEEAQEPLAEDIDEEEEDEEPLQEPQDEVVDDATEEEDDPLLDGEPGPRRKSQDEEKLVWKEGPRRVTDVLVWEAPQQWILEELSLDTPPRRVAEEPICLSGSEIQVWRHQDERQPRLIVPEKGHCHQREENPTQSPKVSIAGPEVPASQS